MKHVRANVNRGPFLGTEDRKRQNLFIENFKKHGIIQKACDACNVERKVVERWIERFPPFVAKMDMAKRMAADYLEAALLERALDGKGNKEASDRLGLAILQAKKAEEYGKDPKRQDKDSVRVIVFKSDLPMPTDDQTAHLQKGKGDKS